LLDRKELERYGPPGFRLGQKEKDYVQHWLLTFLARSGFTAAFKGGTALQKAYGLPRYSEDLGFTLVEGGENPDFESAGAFLSSAGFSGIQWKTRENGLSVAVKMRYRGPLYNGKNASEGTVAVEISKREKVLLKPVAAEISPPYPDLLPYEALVLDKAEIAAEKIRALLTRSSARDLFDLHFLLRLGVRLDLRLVNEKLAYYGTTFDGRLFEKRVGKLAGLWDGEMGALTPAKANYREAKATALQAAKKQLE